MHDGELWQVFQQNGQPVKGRGLLDDAFDRGETLVQGNAHVWLWRKAGGGLEILLQKRSLTKKHSPGYYHISAGGHVNLGETAVQAAVRETEEEVGVGIDPTSLYLVHTTRVLPNWNDLKHVFIYQLNGDEQFSFDDGEVDSVEWCDLDEFKKMTVDAKSYKLVDQGAAYFDPLITAIRRQASL